MKYLLCCIILLITFSCKQKKQDDDHIDIIDTQMAELKKELPLSFKDSIKYAKIWSSFYKSLLNNDTDSIIKMSLKNVYCPVYQNVFNYYADNKLVPLYFFLHAPYKQKYTNTFSSQIDTAKPYINNDALDNQELSDFGFAANENINGFSLNFYTEEIANNYKIWRSHKFKFIEDKGNFKFMGLKVEENGSQYQWKSIPIDSLYFPYDSSNNFSNRLYSQYLLQFKEPQLYKKQDDDEVYRFTWLRSFDNPVVIRFIKHNDTYTLYTKEMLDYEGYIPQQIKVDTKQEMTKYVWSNFKDKLDDIDFWNLQSKDPGPGVMDGALWVMEGLQKNKYHFTDRHSPEDKKYKDCCKYLLTLSNLNISEKNIY